MVKMNYFLLFYLPFQTIYSSFANTDSDFVFINFNKGKQFRFAYTGEQTILVFPLTRVKVTVIGKWTVGKRRKMKGPKLLVVNHTIFYIDLLHTCFVTQEFYFVPRFVLLKKCRNVFFLFLKISKSWNPIRFVNFCSDLWYFIQENDKILWTNFHFGHKIHLFIKCHYSMRCKILL